MGAFKIGRLAFLSYTLYLRVVQADYFAKGPVAPREWAQRTLVGASPPHAGRGRPVGCGPHLLFLEASSFLSFPFLLLSFLALSLSR